MAHRHERNYARRAALQTLYAAEINGVPADELAETGDLLDEEGNFNDYALLLVKGVEEYRDEIDDAIDAASENWALDRMPMVDRALLRMTVYEMLHVDMVPLSVSINEAVDLAKEYGGEDESHRFVNGVLGEIAARIADGELAAADKTGDEGIIEDDVEAGEAKAFAADELAGEGAEAAGEPAADAVPAEEAEIDG